MSTVDYPYPSRPLPDHFAPAEVRGQRSRNVFVPMASVSGKPRLAKVDTWARERLLESSREDHVGQPTAATLRTSTRALLGESVYVDGCWWEVAAVCPCQPWGWTKLTPLRTTLEGDDVLPPLLSPVPCVHAPLTDAGLPVDERAGVADVPHAIACDGDMRPDVNGAHIKMVNVDGSDYVAPTTVPRAPGTGVRPGVRALLRLDGEPCTAYVVAERKPGQVAPDGCDLLLSLDSPLGRAVTGLGTADWATYVAPNGREVFVVVAQVS